MTTITRTPHAAGEEREPTVDSLGIRNAVIGDGLMLTQAEGRWVIHTLDSGRAKLLGEYTDVASALEALDALDSIDVLDAAA